MGALPAGTRSRRVGFRDGTNEELSALHAVESVVEAERRPGVVPQPLDSYIAFARSLASTFEDHTWIVETDAGVPVASGACWSNAAGDDRVMECDLFVLGEHRRRGIGSHLFELFRMECERERRTRLTWSTFDAVPAGAAFSQYLGARVARVNRTSEQQLADTDWAMVERWRREGPERAPGYSLQMVIGALPETLFVDAARFHHIMQTMPRDDLDVGDVALTVDDVAQIDRSHVEAGREKWTVFVRDPEGTCVGGTEVLMEPWEPVTAMQQNTGIDPAHRGRGLAKWAKAAMLERIRAERPDVARVRTGNAFSNAPMLAINDALGFRVISSRTEWQIEVAEVRRRATAGAG